MSEALPLPPGPVRTGLGLLAAAAVAALGALILGEYELHPEVAIPAGALLGVLLGEVAVALGRSRWWPVVVIVAALGAASLVWAGWIDSGRGLEPIKGGAYLGAATAALAGGLRVTGLGWISRVRRGAAR